MVADPGALSDVGGNLHRLRLAAGLSLAQLAAAGGISKTTLHGIEQGQGNPTLRTLYALAAALGVPLGDLLATPETPQVVRAGEGARVDGEAVHARLLHRVRLHGTVEIYELAVDPVEQRSAPHLPGVEEVVVATEGQLCTGPEESPVALGPGDAVRFDGGRPHLYRGMAGGAGAVLLMLHPEARRAGR